MGDASAPPGGELVACTIAARLLSLGYGHTALIEALSCDGGRLSTSVELEYGAMVDLVFELAGERVWVCCMTLERVGESRLFRFHLTTPKHKQRIDDFIARGGSENGRAGA